ncbi:universal stress protein [Halobiforma nitratireducens]|uniref:UspA domain-containing protein n=1 Tax=Halobiforma nitratireducens JCM 10879 TaxID=1227454 RepID=M0LUV4_9EURY|nr:universal stress protein [Halobiforma nitratireducens]EMA37352.1 UspA domain-containing protein [Halobiforma nitratireducens JCM 10879]
MISVDSVLVPTDGSASADATVADAIEFARTYGADVHALYVLEEGVDCTDLGETQREAVAAPSERRGREATIEVTNRADDSGLESTRAVREGVAHREILAYAEEHDVGLIAMGTRGRTGPRRARMGSTTERVLTLGDTSVLSVPLTGRDDVDDDDDTVDRTIERIVVPTDGSDAADRAAESAVEIASRYDADVRTVYVVDATVYDLSDSPRSIVGLLTEGGENATEAVAKQVRERDLEVATSVRRGVPADELLEYASAVDADLIAMGTRGRAAGAQSDRLLGSTTARAISRSTIPVLALQ